MPSKRIDAPSRAADAAHSLAAQVALAAGAIVPSGVPIAVGNGAGDAAAHGAGLGTTSAPTCGFGCRHVATATALTPGTWMTRAVPRQRRPPSDLIAPSDIGQAYRCLRARPAMPRQSVPRTRSLPRVGPSGVRQAVPAPAVSAAAFDPGNAGTPDRANSVVTGRTPRRRRPRCSAGYAVVPGGVAATASERRPCWRSRRRRRVAGLGRQCRARRAPAARREASADLLRGVVATPAVIRFRAARLWRR